jgi:hypothetical protein
MIRMVVPILTFMVSSSRTHKGWLEFGVLKRVYNELQCKTSGCAPGHEFRYQGLRFCPAISSKILTNS